MKRSKTVSGAAYRGSKKSVFLNVQSMRAFTRFASATGVFAVAFLAAFMSASVFTAPDPSNAEQIAMVARNSLGYQITIATDEVTSADLVTSQTGSTAVVSSTVNVISDASDGYTVYIAMDNKDQDGNRMYKDGDKASGDFLEATSGTYDAPAVLDNKAWGYAVAGVNNFDSSYATNMIQSTNKFAALPLQGHEQVIGTSSTVTSQTGDDITVYYGARADSTLPIGTYKANVVYTAVSNNAASGMAYISPRETTEIYGGDTLTITTGLVASAADVEAAATAQGVEVASVKVGGDTCAFTGISNDGDNHIVITCTMPGHDTGRYDVAVFIPSYDAEYFLSNVLEYKHYIRTTYDFWNIEYMHELTADICNETPTPENTVTTVTGKLTREEQKDLAYQINAVNPALQNNFNKIPQTYLIDKRDMKSYVIRKLADGNCWMAQNLALAAGSTISHELSNVPESYGTWNLPVSSTSFSSNTAATMNNGTHVDNDVRITVNTSNDNKGAYYSWCTAVAGESNCNSITAAGKSSDIDICPRNWRLPINGEYNDLYVRYSSNKGTLDTVRPTIYAGYSVSSYVGSNGYWWSSTASSGTNAYYLCEDTSGNIYPACSGVRYYGLSVRCLVAR